MELYLQQSTLLHAINPLKLEDSSLLSIGDYLQYKMSFTFSLRRFVYICMEIIKIQRICRHIRIYGRKVQFFY